MDVVVVESPAKAKTINKYLGNGYIVLASYGHVRDLPSKDGSVLPDDDFAMTYVTDDQSAKRVKAIADAMRGSDRLILATDPDREGEAISWHVMKALEDDYGFREISAQRVVFNEITKRAVIEGINNPRELDMDLINAQQARRALDYLVGFTLSPVLWRKLPGAKSAGRVQSVALRLICEREIEIEAFRAREYWTVEVDFKTAHDAALIGRLTHLNGQNLIDSPLRIRRQRRQPNGRWRVANFPSAVSRPSRPSAIPNLHSPPPPCSRRPPASLASAPGAPCRWRKSCTKDSISVARPWG